MGERSHRDVSEEQAIKSWYDRVYMPLIRIIRKKEILAKFPTRTEADLYLWIIEHRYYLMMENKRGISFEKAAVDFVSRYSKRSFSSKIKAMWMRVIQLFRKKI